jgi:hypothetical protein
MVPAYVAKEPSDEWEWYYLMQHYSLPTRLLDWTESALIGLYFAVDRTAADKAPCVWMMDPASLNRAAHGPDEDVIIVPVDMESDIRYWLPSSCGRGKTPHVFPDGSRFKANSKPLAILPKRYNPRIVAQRGTFTIHGCEETPIEAVLATVGDPDPRIAKITIDPSGVSKVKRDLRMLGLSKASLFPEPQSVAEDLKAIYEIRD